jgi:hypothetical protein
MKPGRDAAQRWLRQAEEQGERAVVAVQALLSLVVEGHCWQLPGDAVVSCRGSYRRDLVAAIHGGRCRLAFRTPAR